MAGRGLYEGPRGCQTARQRPGEAPTEASWKTPTGRRCPCMHGVTESFWGSPWALGRFPRASRGPQGDPRRLWGRVAGCCELPRAVRMLNHAFKTSIACSQCVDAASVCYNEEGKGASTLPTLCGSRGPKLPNTVKRVYAML